MDKEKPFNETRCRDCSVREKSLFKGIPGKRLDGLQGFRKEQINVSAKSVVFDEGDMHDNVYTLFSGWAAIYKTVNNNGKRQILRFILPGDLVGYQVSPNGFVSHSAIAVTNCVFCVFQRDSMKEMLKCETDLAVRLVEMESKEMSLCQSHLMAAGRKTAKESISFLLMELYWRVRMQVPDSYIAETNTFDFPITQEEIGDAVGLTKIHVNRVIQGLVHDGLICFHKKQLTILDEAALCAIAEFNPETINERK